MPRSKEQERTRSRKRYALLKAEGGLRWKRLIAVRAANAIKYNRRHKRRVKASRQRWYQKNRVRVLARTRAATLAKYGLSQLQYDELLRNQNGSCAICLSPKIRFKYNLHIDHCHKTGRVRGLLCNTCNRILVGMCDNYPGLVDRLQRYMLR